MSIFTQTTTEATDNQKVAQVSAGATMAASMTMMPPAQTCQNQQQASQRQQPQAIPTPSNLFTQAENNPVFCFFYSYQPIPTSFTKRSAKIVKRPEEILNHARQGGARI